jgi:hypothetical protein
MNTMTPEISVIGGPLPGAITTVGTLSGGSGSWAACRRWIDQRGTDGMIAIFTDVGGDPSNPNTGEDEDTIRFLCEARADLGIPLVFIRDGRDIWDVFAEKKWLGNTTLAHCSWELKTGPARAWITEHAPGARRILVGIDATEADRIGAITRAWEPFQATAPLMDRPRWWKPQVAKMLDDRGIRLPRMYGLGFAHANCPACVKAGQAHWARLLRVWPERYAYAEMREQELREKLGKDVSILRDRTGGGTVPMTLKAFRERIETAGCARAADGQRALFDEYDEGGCGCFTGTSPRAAA